MAIFTLIAPFDQFHGKVTGPSGSGGVVVWSVGQANYSRAFVTPSNPESDLQVAIRGFLAASSQGFSATSAAEAAGWNAAAVGVIRQNALGQDYELSGAGLYSLINTYRQMDGQALLDVAPLLTAPGAITGITSVQTDGTDIEVVFTHTLDTPSDLIFIRFTQDLGGDARQARSNEFRTITALFTTSIVASSVSPQTVTVQMDNFVVAGASNIGVEILPLGDTYFPGVPRSDKNIVVGAI